MALDNPNMVLNVAAATAILNKANVDQATKAKGVVLAAVVPGALGLAVPIILARNAKASGTGGGPQPGPQPVSVPDVTTGHPSVDAATTQLAARRLVAVTNAVFGDTDDNGKVVGQDPLAGERVPLDSQVTIFVGAGLPPAAPPEQGLEATMRQVARDSTSAISGQLTTMQTALTDAITAGH